MKNNFVVGNNYYLKINLSSHLPHLIWFVLMDDGKYNHDGSWHNTPTGTNYWLLYNDNDDVDYIQFYDNDDTLIDEIDLSGCDNVQIYGKFNLIHDANNDPIPPTEESYKFYQKVAIDSPTEIWFGNLIEPLNKLYKTDPTDVFYGVLREDIDILNPSILIEMPESTTFTYSYAQIPDLNRYYYVVGITCVRKNLYRIVLRVDVLRTYADDIFSQHGLITRNENVNTNSDSYLMDERIPLIDKKSVYYGSDNNDISPTSYEFQTNLASTDYTIIFTCINDSSITSLPSTISPPSGSGLNTINRRMNDNPIAVSYAITIDDWKTLAEWLNQNSNLLDYVVSVVAYPFKVQNDAWVSTGLVGVRINNTNTTISGYIMKGETSLYIQYAKYTDYLPNEQGVTYMMNYEPYTIYEIFLPYHGWEKIDSYQLIGKTIVVFYVIDYTTGGAYINIWNQSDKSMVATYPVQLGVKLSTSQTNAVEIEKQKQSMILNAVLGYGGSLVSGITGAASGNPLLLMASLGGLVKTSANFINKSLTLVEHTNTQLGGDSFGLYNPLKVKIRETRTAYVNIDWDVFAHENGYKVNTYDEISNVGASGYYMEIEKLHYVPMDLTFITKPEIDEIVSLVKNGIII